ncbi:hypothetical protein V1505DRAFT_399723 [Lipomyces doorenjongii]
MSPAEMTTNNHILLSKSAYYGDFPKLKGEENYLTWKQRMLLHLRALPLTGLSDEKQKRNNNALSGILINMESAYQKVHITASMARDVWTALEEQFALIWAASKPRLMSELYSTKVGVDVTLETHFRQLSHVRDQLATTGMRSMNRCSSKPFFALSPHSIVMLFLPFSLHLIYQQVRNNTLTNKSKVFKRTSI